MLSKGCVLFKLHGESDLTYQEGHKNGLCRRTPARHLDRRAADGLQLLLVCIEQNVLLEPLRPPVRIKNNLSLKSKSIPALTRLLSH